MDKSASTHGIDMQTRTVKALAVFRCRLIPYSLLLSFIEPCIIACVIPGHHKVLERLILDY